MVKNIVLGIVVVLHLMLLFVLFSPQPDKSARSEGQKSVAESESAVPEGSEIPSESSPAPAEPSAADRPSSDTVLPGTGAAPVSGMDSPVSRGNAVPRTVVQQPYSPGYFAGLDRKLPAALQKDISACRAAGLFDVKTHTRIWGRNVSQPYPIASLTKMMTALLLMEDLQQKSDRVTLETMVQVSRAAAKIGGRQVWLDPREKFSVEDLLKSMMIRSANDCAYQLGEFLGGGDVNAFVARMNRRAAELNCRGFKFYNCHGLPTDQRKENYGSVSELGYLAERLWQYPQLIKWTSTREDAIRENTKKPFQLLSTNHLLRTCPGTVGLKTGMTNRAGYCLVAICERNQRKIIAVVLGVSAKAGGYRVRDRIARGLIEWAFSEPL